MNEPKGKPKFHTAGTAGAAFHGFLKAAMTKLGKPRRKRAYFQLRCARCGTVSTRRYESAAEALSVAAQLRRQHMLYVLVPWTHRGETSAHHGGDCGSAKLHPMDLVRIAEAS